MAHGTFPVVVRPFPVAPHGELGAGGTPWHRIVQKIRTSFSSTSSLTFPKEGHFHDIKSSRVKFCSVWIIPQPRHNPIFCFRWLNFFSLFSGAFLNIDINLLSWKQTKLLYFLSSPIVCTSDLFTKRPGLHSHKSRDSAFL